MDLARILAFWGKARPYGGAAMAHPAALHCLDVAAAASALAPGFARSLAPDLAAHLPLLAALHDIGKFSRAFQAQAPEHWPADVLGPLGPAWPFRHDQIGLWLLAEPLADDLAPLFGAAPSRPLLAALAGHHGRPAAEEEPPEGAVGAAAIAGARAFVHSLLQLFAPAGLARRRAAQAAADSWALAGVLALADWLGSSQAHFPYVPATEVTSLADYWHRHALPRATAAVAASGMAAGRPAAWGGMRRVFPAIAAPTPVQRWAETAPLPAGPVLAVIEDATGSGKTEAAITLAHRILADGRAHGIFVGLPTMATAGAMYRRLAGAYRALFADDARPSLALAHGQARLDTMFAASILRDEPPADELGDGAEPAGAQCAAWLAEESRRALFAQVVVGTIDQALLSVLPVRHAPLRQAALADKVLILDEVHAYDAYVVEGIKALLARCAAMGGSAILLSATLPRQLREELLGAFAAGLPTPQAVAYPLVTLAGGGGLSETPCPLREGMARCVALQRLDDATAAVRAIAEGAAAGAAVAWVRNTVDDAIAAHALLRAAGIDASLFHARFAMADRLRIEQDVLARFGKDGTNRAHVLVATQVVEQSLDLDFDLMVSDLAPADLVIQRAGRLWRHRRDARPVDGPRLMLLSPAPDEDPPPDWLAQHRGTAAIYPPWLLWQSARALFGAGAIDTPGNVRDLVEAAYRDGIDAPAAMQRHVNRYQGEGFSKAAIAQMNVLKFDKGYTLAAAEGSAYWQPDVRTPTRLENVPQVTLRLAVARDGAVVPYADDADPSRAWALSEVRVAAHRVADAPVPAALAAAAEAARASWGRWEREATAQVKLVVLQPAAEAWQAAVVDGRGVAGVLAYGPTTGIRFHMTDPDAERG